MSEPIEKWDVIPASGSNLEGLYQIVVPGKVGNLPILTVSAPGSEGLQLANKIANCHNAGVLDKYDQ